MGHDFITRLVYLIFIVFAHAPDVKVMPVFMFGPGGGAVGAGELVVGTLNRGPASARASPGSNPNRLGMICLVEMTAFWCPGRRCGLPSGPPIMAGCVAAATLVPLATDAQWLAPLAVTGSPLQTGRDGSASLVAGPLRRHGLLAIIALESWRRPGSACPP
jgi:hypothetical protein